MECCLRFEIIDGYEVVTSAGERTYDPAETDKYIFEHFPEVEEGQRAALYEQHKKYAPLQADEKPLPDNTCGQIKEKLADLHEDEKLLTNGEIINDYRDKEYWIKESDRWTKGKILQLGVDFPQGAIPADDLQNEGYQTQREEIAVQDEEDRMAALTPEQKAEMLQTALDNLADEAARLEKRAQIQRQEFDAIAWYQEGEARLHEKYGMTKEAE